MQGNPALKYNKYFFAPFLLWCLAGGALLWVFSKDDLFRAINTNYNGFLDESMYYLTMLGQAEVIVPVLLLVGLMPGCRNWQYFTVATLCNIVPMAVQQSLKAWFEAFRPLKYYNKADWIHHLPNWDELFHNSFPSGHSEGAFAFFTFLSFLLPKKYKWFGVVFFLLALSVCYSRVYLAAHFFEDVYVGSIVGVAISTLVFMLLNRYSKQIAAVFSAP